MAGQSKASQATKRSGSDEGVLNDLFRGVLKEFGTSPPQIAVLIGIVIGSFGYADSFNPGVWTIVSLFCFGLVYVLWPYVPLNTMRVTGYAVVFLLACILAALFVRWQADKLWTEFTGAKSLLTAFCSIALTIPVAWVIASHTKRNREEGRRAEFWQNGKLDGAQVPEPIFDQIVAEIGACPLFKSDVAYRIQARRRDDGVAFKTTMSYIVANRGPAAVDWDAEYVFGAARPSVGPVLIDDEPEDLGHKGYVSERGIKVPKSIPPGGSLKVSIEVTEQFAAAGNELFTTYTPAVDFMLAVEHEPSLEFWYDRLFAAGRAEEGKTGERLECRVEGGILPYQGVRLWWAPKPP